MNNIESILQESNQNKWPYPKRFEVLKKAGVLSHRVSFIGNFDSVYEGSFGTWQEPVSVEYTSPQLSDKFSEEGIKIAIINRAQGKTSYWEFLADIAEQGVSHYKADMNNRSVIYFNENEDLFYQQIVPIWND